MSDFFRKFKPGISKRYLLIVAALLWTFAGYMLLSRGFGLMLPIVNLTWVSVLSAVFIGVVFYKLFFNNIATKHIRRIVLLETDKPCIFSFFNLKAYVMMILMISMGVALRLSGLVPYSILSFCYLIMGTPLLISSVRFYYSGFNFNQTIDKFSR